MSLIFNWDARLGTLIDSVSKTKGIINGTPKFIETEKGLTLYDKSTTNQSGFIYTNTPNYNNASLVCAFKTDTTFPYHNLICATDNNGERLQFYISTSINGFLWFFANGNYEHDNTTDYRDNKWHLVVGTWDGVTRRMWVDNKKITFVNKVSVGTQTTNQIWIGDGCTTNGLNGYIGFKAQVYDHVLTTQERNKLYEEFQRSIGIREIKRNPARIMKQTDLSNEDGLVFASNMVPSTGAVLTDISGNGNDGTIHGALSTPRGLKFDGMNAVITTGSVVSLSGESTYVVRIKSTDNSTIQRIIELDIAKRNLSLLSDGKLNVYDGTNGVNGTQDLNDGLWHNVVVVYKTNDIKFYIDGSEDIISSGSTFVLNTITNKILTIGRVGLSFKGEIADVKIYNYAFTPQQAKDYHNSFLETVYINTFKDDGADGIVKLPNDFTAGTGSYKVGELSTAVSTPKLDVGQKYLECATGGAGTTAIQSSQAYGEWEFDLYKGANGSSFYDFINTQSDSDGNGYSFWAPYDGTLRIYVTTNGGQNPKLFETAINYIANNTWYRIKIARLSSEGVFTDIGNDVTYAANTFAVFIKGGSFGNTWTLVQPNGESLINGAYTHNPVTDSTYKTSNYFVADLDAGDRITNIKITNQAKV